MLTLTRPGGVIFTPPSRYCKISQAILTIEQWDYPLNLSLHKPEQMQPVSKQNIVSTSHGSPAKLKSQDFIKKSKIGFLIILPFKQEIAKFWLLYFNRKFSSFQMKPTLFWNSNYNQSYSWKSVFWCKFEFSYMKNRKKFKGVYF